MALNPLSADEMLTAIQCLHKVMTQKWPQNIGPALFVHGNVDLKDELLENTVDLFKKYKMEYLLLNGMTVEECITEKINYHGYEDWKKTLIEKFKIPESQIHPVSPAHHTFAEATSLVKICQEKKWKKIAIASLPYHSLRCALTHLAAQQKANVQRQLYMAQPFAIEWQITMTKQLLGGEILKTSRQYMILEEWERILRYQKKGDCAPFADLLNAL